MPWYLTGQDQMIPKVIVGALFPFHTRFRNLSSEIIMLDSLRFRGGFHALKREVTGII